MDIVKRLENLLAKDQVVAFDWGENGVSIDADLEAAIEELRHSYKIGAQVEDEDGNTGQVRIYWNDGDILSIEDDTAHPGPRKID